MVTLARLQDPSDLRSLNRDEIRALASEIRALLIDRVSRTGGHLGPNLGVVELTIALHAEFESPRDRILFDTGHQAYVHKVLTGRGDQFERLRQRGGLSGYPSRAESAHDFIENSHASTGLSYADGLAKADALAGRTDRHVVVVVGDGALTGGMAWEALNNIAASGSRNLIIVVNDNGRSYAPTVGGFAQHLGELRAPCGNARLLRPVRTPHDTVHMDEPVPGPRDVEPGQRNLATPQPIFNGLGLTYLGPVDGHDIDALRAALAQARGLHGPVVVHCATRKGAGYRPAEEHEADCLHTVAAADPATGRPRSAPHSWTSVFGQMMVDVGRERADVVAVTAAMRGPVGLDPFAAAFPDRVFDVGIAEQHAVTSAVGMSMGGLHPVVAIYATFLNRAFDQVLMDAALHRAAMTLVLDRAGITGEDGPSHHGMWDLSVLQVVPGLRIAAPRDGPRLRTQLREAIAVDDGPTVVRFPKGVLPSDIPELDRYGATDVLDARGAAPAQILLVSVGAMATTCLRVARDLAGDGPGVTVVDPRWIKPVDASLVEFAAAHRLVVTVEDNSLTGGFGTVLSQALCSAGVEVPVRSFGIPARFIAHGSRKELLEEVGLAAPGLAASIRAAYANVVERRSARPQRRPQGSGAAGRSSAAGCAPGPGR